MTMKPSSDFVNNPTHSARYAGNGSRSIRNLVPQRADEIDATSPRAPEHIRDAFKAAEILMGTTLAVSHPMLAKVDQGRIRLLATDAQTRGARAATLRDPQAQLGGYQHADKVRNSLRDLISTLEKTAADLDAFIAEEYPLVTPELLAERAADEARRAAERAREGLELRAREQAARELLDEENARQRAAIMKAERERDARAKSILARLEADLGIVPNKG